MVAGPISAPMPKTRPGGKPGKRLIEHWRVFGPGRWLGQDWTAKQIGEMVANYRKFVKPITSPDPFYIPYVSINHADGSKGLASGDVLDCGQDPDGWLWVTFDVGDAVAAALDAGHLRHASIAWWNTNLKTDRDLSGFVFTPDGKPIGLILCDVSLLGAMPPGCKGQPRPPKSKELADSPWLQKFNAPVPASRVLVEIPNVDELIQKLMAAVPGLSPEQYQSLAMASMGGGEVAPAIPPADNLAMDPAMGDPMKQMFADFTAFKVQTAAKIAELEADKKKSATEREAEAQAVSDALIQKFHDQVIAEKAAVPAEATRIFEDLKAMSPALRETNVAIMSRRLGLTGQKAPPADRQFADRSATGGNGPNPAIPVGMEKSYNLMRHSQDGRRIIGERLKQQSKNN